MIKLLFNEFVPARTTGPGRSGQAEDVGAVGNTGEGSGLDAGGANIVPGNHAEQLPKAFDFLVQQYLYGLGCPVTTGDARSACRHYGIDLRICDPGRDLGADLVNVITHDLAVGELMPGFPETVLQDLARGVILQGPGVGYGKHGDG